MLFSVKLPHGYLLFSGEIDNEDEEPTYLGYFDKEGIEQLCRDLIENPISETILNK